MEATIVDKWSKAGFSAKAIAIALGSDLIRVALKDNAELEYGTTDKQEQDDKGNKAEATRAWS